MTMNEDDAVRQFAAALLNLLGAIRSAEANRTATEVRRLVAELREANGPARRNREEQKPMLLSTREAAKSLSVSPRTLWDLTAPRGPIPVVKIGTRTCYAIRDLEQAIEKMKSK